MNSDFEGKRIHKNPMGKLVSAVLTCSCMGFLFVGGGCARYEEECAELRNLIEQKDSQQNVKVEQMAGHLTELNEKLVDLSDDFRNFSRRVSDMEASRNRYNEDLANQNRRLEEKYTSLLNRFESLSRQMAENSSSVRQVESQMRQLEHQRRNVTFPDQPQGAVRSEPTLPVNVPEESLDDLQQKIERNLREIKQLVQKNPGCYLNPSSTSIINLDRKIATAKDRRYCNSTNVTFVRDRFYCTGCKQVTGIRNGDYDRANACCRISSQQGFYRWLDARKRIDETALINRRIDELYAENENLEKRIRTFKHSQQRR